MKKVTIICLVEEDKGVEDVSKQYIGGFRELAKIKRMGFVSETEESDEADLGEFRDHLDDSLIVWKIRTPGFKNKLFKDIAENLMNGEEPDYITLAKGLGLRADDFEEKIIINAASVYSLEYRILLEEAVDHFRRDGVPCVLLMDSEYTKENALEKIRSLQVKYRVSDKMIAPSYLYTETNFHFGNSADILMKENSAGSTKWLLGFWMKLAAIMLAADMEEPEKY